ncbi:hypothetical protein HBI47_197860 [Parastagonospora nodorum]|nr:hypothetical protein HBI47_197860 [Parastagonospora nodorum]KAH6395826.1 hypothetical protein HBI14_191920 [Parastagonospora nodorum]
MSLSQRATSFEVPASSGDESSNTNASSSRNYHKPPVVKSELSSDLAWSERNLLSLDGGGIRGYWTLLVLQQLMKYIANEELKRKDDDDEHHSFFPSQFPEHVTQGKDDEDERRKQQAAPGARVFTWEYVREARKFLPCHYFDYICGSSTGALIAIMLGRFRMPVWDCLREYEKMSHSIFGKPRLVSQRNIGIVRWPKYSSTALEEAFQEVTARRGERTARSIDNVTFPSPPGICKTFVTAFAYERRRNAPVSEMRLYLLRTYEHERREGLILRGKRRTNTGTFNEENRNYGSADNWPIWRVARAATAAPMYFKELAEKRNVLQGKTTIYFSDGGFGHTNNPTFEGVTEIKALHGNKSLGAVVNVGTSRKKLKPGGKSIFKRVYTSFDRVTDPKYVAEKVAALELSAYWRFNDENGIGVDLDEWEPNGYFSKHPGAKTLETIETKFNKWAMDGDNNKHLRDCAKELVARRRARARNVAKWEVYATNASFACIHDDCRNTPFAERTALEDHIRRDHATSESEVQSMVKRATKMWQYQIPHRS